MVSDMAIKSFVTSMSTINTGVMTARPAMTSPMARNGTISIGHRVECASQQPLERDPPLADGKDDAGEARLSHHHARRCLGADDTVMPIYACRSAGASLLPSRHILTTCLWAGKPFTNRCLSSGTTRAKMPIGPRLSSSENRFGEWHR